MNLTSALRARTGAGPDGTITTLHHAEDELVRAFLDLSDRHAADHEIHVVARDLASWSQEHVRRLASAGSSHGLDLHPEPSSRSAVPAVLKRVTAGALSGLRSPSGALLADLRAVHLAAAGVSIDWEILAQSAQAGELSDLAELAADCHPQALRQVRWTNAQVKELAAQAVLSS